MHFILLGPARDNAFQHVGQVGHRIDAVQLGCLDQCHRDCPMNGSAVITREQRIFARKGIRSDRPLNHVRVHLESKRSSDALLQ